MERYETAAPDGERCQKKTPGSKWTKFVQGGCWHGMNRSGRKIDDGGYRKETMIN